MATDVIVKHADKVELIYNFLQFKNDKRKFLVVVDDGGIGKSSALIEAMAKMDKEDLFYKVVIWNDGEMPSVKTNFVNHGDNEDMTWILIRREFDALVTLCQVKNGTL